MYVLLKNILITYCFIFSCYVVTSDMAKDYKELKEVRVLQKKQDECLQRYYDYCLLSTCFALPTVLHAASDGYDNPVDQALRFSFFGAVTVYSLFQASNQKIKYQRFQQ